MPGTANMTTRHANKKIYQGSQQQLPMGNDPMAMLGQPQLAAMTCSSDAHTTRPHHARLLQ
jgi:hypothetical protein